MSCLSFSVSFSVSLCLSLFLSVSVSLCLSLFLSVSVSVSLSISVCLCLCVSLSPCGVVCCGVVWCAWCCVLCCVCCVWCVVWCVARLGMQKKPPCVDSKRPRVHRHHAHMCYHMRAWCRYTRGGQRSVRVPSKLCCGRVVLQRAHHRVSACAHRLLSLSHLWCIFVCHPHLTIISCRTAVWAQACGSERKTSFVIIVHLWFIRYL